jgi:voltage-gated potassium channel
MLVFITKLWRILRMYDGRYLILPTLLHYFSFWMILIFFESPDAKIIEPINYWYYWSTTVLTIGYGDLSPASSGGRLVTPLFQFSGIVLLTLFLTKGGMWVVDYTSKKRRGLVKTTAKNHILVIGDFNAVRVGELLGNAIYDRKDDGQHDVAVVCCFRNTGDKNPFDGDLTFIHGVMPEYVQAGPNGFTLKTFQAAKAADAHHIYVMTDDDTTAIGIVGALSHLNVKAPVAVLLREKSSEELIPDTKLDLRIILPAQAMLAVREMEDPGAGAAVAELIDVERDESIYSFEVVVDGVREYKTARTAFETIFGDRGILLGIARRNGAGWKTTLRAPAHEAVHAGDRIIYVADADFNQDDIKHFNVTLAS